MRRDDIAFFLREALWSAVAPATALNHVFESGDWRRRTPKRFARNSRG
jgi:hypothetical protein